MFTGKSLLLFLIGAVALSACDPGTASHLPNPLAVPGQALGTTFDNTTYNAKRRKVSSFVEANHRFLIDDIALGGGSTLSQAMDLAGVAAQKRPDLTAQLSKDLGLYAAVEPLTVALMVHGN